MIAIDTNVFIYALDADEPIKQTKAQQLLAQLCGGSSSAVLPWQVAGEILNNLRRSEAAGRVSAAEVESHLRSFLAMFPLVVPSARHSPSILHCRVDSAYRTGTPCCSPLAGRPE